MFADTAGSDQTAQSDLGIRCPHMLEVTFSHDAAQIIPNKMYFWHEAASLMDWQARYRNAFLMFSSHDSNIQRELVSRLILSNSACKKYVGYFFLFYYYFFFLYMACLFTLENAILSREY